MSDDFDNIIDGLEIEDPSDVIDVTTLETKELADKLHEIETELLEQGQMLHPHQQWARDKHSLRNAIKLELNRRLIA